MDEIISGFTLDQRVLDAEQVVEQHFGPSRRLDHSVGCASTAILLAELYQADPNTAALAGLLHDWDKNCDAVELKKKAFDAGVAPELLTDDYVSLLHAFTAPATLRERFEGIDEEILTAIAKHTVADVDMSPLDAILYIADTIEPTRGADVDESSNDRRKRYVAELGLLREAVGSVTLERLLFLSYQQNIVWVIRTGRPLYPETAKIYNVLRSDG